MAGILGRNLYLGHTVMDTLLLFTNMALALYLAYQSGKFGALIEYDRDIFNIKSDRMMYVYWIVDFILAAYFIISIFGRGIELGRNSL